MSAVRHCWVKAGEKKKNPDKRFCLVYVWPQPTAGEVCDLSSRLYPLTGVLQVSGGGEALTLSIDTIVASSQYIFWYQSLLWSQRSHRPLVSTCCCTIVFYPLMTSATLVLILVFACPDFLPTLISQFLPSVLLPQLFFAIIYFCERIFYQHEGDKNSYRFQPFTR